MKFKDNSFKLLKKQDYQNLIDKVISDFKNYDWLLGIGQFGEIRDPGISDLDLVFFVKNGFLKKAFKKFEIWINKNDTNREIFFHYPNFLSESTLEYAHHLHTLTNIKWIYSRYKIQIKKNPNKELLNVMWTTFLIPIVIDILEEKSIRGVKASLLILKNLHQSHSNLSGMLGLKSDKLERTQSIRNACIYEIRNGDKVGKKLMSIIEEEFESTYREVMSLLDRYSMLNFRLKTSLLKYFSASKKLLIIKSNNSFYTYKENRICLYLNRWLFNYMFNSRNRSPSFQQYLYALKRTYNIYSNEGIPFQFILPFSYPVFREGNIFRIKLIYRLFRDHFLLYDK